MGTHLLSDIRADHGGDGTVSNRQKFAVRTSTWLTSGILRCVRDECGAEFQDWRTAEKEAMAHARATGHGIEGELCYALRYEPMSAPPEREER